MPNIDLLAVKKSLYDRRQTAVVVPYELTSIKSGNPREARMSQQCRSIRS
jgi:hypothetical protein